MELKHKPKHIDEILYCNKCLTARLLHAFPEYNEIEEGDTLELTTPGGFKFAEVKINKIAVMSVKQFAAARIDGHKTYSSAAQLIDELEGYYPDFEGDITGMNRLVVIWYEDITSVNEIRSVQEESTDEN